MSWSQIVLSVLLALGFLRSVKEDFEGRPEKQPMGFVGFCCSVVVFAIVVLLYWHSWFGGH